MCQVVVPKPIKELCTRDVLVMEYIKGVKLIDGIKAHFGRIAKSKYGFNRRCRNNRMCDTTIGGKP